MSIFTERERTRIFENICSRLYLRGFEGVRDYSKKNALIFPFHITTRDFTNLPTHASFIFITELFGDQQAEKHPFMQGVNRQYQGNLKGLNRTILLYTNGKGFPNPEIETVGDSVTDELRSRFDEALEYIDRGLISHTPETIRFPNHRYFDQFNSLLTDEESFGDII